MNETFVCDAECEQGRIDFAIANCDGNVQSDLAMARTFPDFDFLAWSDEWAAKNCPGFA